MNIAFLHRIEVTPLTLSEEERSQGVKAVEIEESVCPTADRISWEQEQVHDRNFESG